MQLATTQWMPLGNASEQGLLDDEAVKHESASHDSVTSESVTSESVTSESKNERHACEKPAVTCVDLPGKATNATVENGSLGRLGEKIPQAIGKYEVRELLGRGGQATALLAWDPDLQREVVLKLYHAAKTPAERAAVLREGQTLVQVHSPFVAQCFAAERHGDIPYLVMEYVRGESLADRLREQPLSLDETLRLLEQLAQGLSAVHASGVLHRDLKPSNLLLTADGQPKLIDFGLAAEMGSDQLRQISGTPAYMAPEQASGDVERLDARTDLFGLGAVFYELLTGRPPYLGESAASVWRQARDGRVVPAIGRVSSLRKDVNEVVMRCLARDPQARFGSAEEVLAALDVLRHGKRRHWNWTLGWGKVRFRLALGVSVLASIVALVMAFPSRDANSRYRLESGLVAMTAPTESRLAAPSPSSGPSATIAADTTYSIPDAPNMPVYPEALAHRIARLDVDRKAAKIAVLRPTNSDLELQDQHRGASMRGGVEREAGTDTAIRMVPRDDGGDPHGDSRFSGMPDPAGHATKAKEFRHQFGTKWERCELAEGEVTCSWCIGAHVELKWASREPIEIWEEVSTEGVARRVKPIEWSDSGAEGPGWHYYLLANLDEGREGSTAYWVGPWERPVEKKREAAGDRAD